MLPCRKGQNSIPARPSASRGWIPKDLMSTDQNWLKIIPRKKITQRQATAVRAVLTFRLSTVMF